ncbi:MAG: type II toxin-antitoxin system VapC family toxin [Chloroherpetonaceae bacterium]|nr:type II toxin-antitoxin system VapC family toxin [Chloroherpetonaceae bacterium]
MEQRYLIDTNVIIDNFGNKLTPSAKFFFNNLEIIISAITKIELLGWKGATENQLTPVYRFIELVTVLPISEDVVNLTISIRQSKKIALGDALIAATAIVYDFNCRYRNCL